MLLGADGVGQEPLLASLKGEDVAGGRRLREVKRVLLDSAAGCYGCVVPKGAWHSVEVLAPSVRQKTENTAKTAANRGSHAVAYNGFSQVFSSRQKGRIMPIIPILSA